MNMMRTPDSLPPKVPRNTMNKEVVNSVVVLIDKYRQHNAIPNWKVLEHGEIDQMLEGIKDMVYRHEGIKKPQYE